MKLFLSGGGSGKDPIELDKKFVQALDTKKPVLYIPIAINTDKHPYPECLKWIRAIFQPLGFDNFIIWAENDLQVKTLKSFEQFGGIYIGGGNTFKLLKELKEFGTLEILKQLAGKDVPIYGGSAGAIILGRTITTAVGYDENNINLTDLSALDLVNGYEIWCHYSGSEEMKVKEYMGKYHLEKVIAIPESAGLFVTESSIKVVGPSDVQVFENGSIKTLNPEQGV